MSLASILAVTARGSVPGTCTPKPDRYGHNGLVDEFGSHCLAPEVINDNGACQAYQQFCDWEFDTRAGVNEVATDLSNEEIFGSTDVIASTYSSDFALKNVVQAGDGYWYRQDDDGTILPNRESKWVFWHYDVLTSPAFVWPFNTDGNHCDCNDGEREVQSDGWSVNAGARCGWSCGKDALYVPESNTGNGEYPPILQYNNTVHHRFCMRESDLNDVAWDPSYHFNHEDSLNVIFPTRFGPGGLNMQRGERPSSWYFYGASKPSWNENDQTSNVYVGERRYDTEEECRQEAVNFFRQTFNNDYFKMLTHCDMLSSRCPTVSNRECSDACKGEQSVITEHPLFKSMTRTERLAFVKDKCSYTPYQPENDHAWPNFYVPDNNKCFGQWQIGWEDQACDGNIAADYDNSPRFANGWCYAPNTTPGDFSCAGAQCGKFIMDGPGRPRDVTSAQECQQFCQDDDNCVHWQWRPISDWANSNMANNLNRVRSCNLKSKAQFEGALRARWGSDGSWIWNPLDEGSKYANEYQNADCQPNVSGDGRNHCLQCRDNDDPSVITYHSFKWRNNFVSGPKFCDQPRLYHGNAINRPASHFSDEWKTLTRTIVDVPMCPFYVKETNPQEATPVVSHLDSDVIESCIARPEYLASGIEGSTDQVKHCDQKSFNSQTPTSGGEDTCNAFYAFCQWHIAFKEPTTDYKGLSEVELGLEAISVSPSIWSSTFDYAEAVVIGGNGTVSSNNLPDRTEKWVFYHAHHNEISFTSCDCLEPRCEDSACADIAVGADVLKVHFLADKVCHKESDVMGTRFDPAAVWSKNEDYLATTVDWREGLGMSTGEAGAGFYWYTIAKPSWNEWPQSAHNAKFSYMNFDTEFECRSWAEQYWDQKMNYPNSMLSVCEMFSSTNISVSNSNCRDACLGKENPDSSWFKANCAYTPYQAESEHSWPNHFVSDSNDCFGQYQIGYEDQGCDHCMSKAYAANETFADGWNYWEDSSTGCLAQCGKFVMTDEIAANGRFEPKDVKTAQECQQYCQEDKECVHFQWRASPDYTKAPSQYMDDANGVDVILENNHLNKVRLCALKNSDQVIGAMKGRWSEQGVVSGEDDRYNNVAYLVQDSQFASSPTANEGNAWYLKCTQEGDTDATAHAWKWRNNMISGPKFCDSSSTGRIHHGGYAIGDPNSTINVCPSEASLTANKGVSLPVADKDSGRYGDMKFPEGFLGNSVPTQESWDNVPAPDNDLVLDEDWLPDGGIDGVNDDGSNCCNFDVSDCQNAYGYQCLSGDVPGCALACWDNAQWEMENEGLHSCTDVHHYFVDQGFTAKTIEECMKADDYIIPTTTTTTTIAAKCSL